MVERMDNVTTPSIKRHEVPIFKFLSSSMLYWTLVSAIMAQLRTTRRLAMGRANCTIKQHRALLYILILLCTNS